MLPAVERLLLPLLPLLRTADEEDAEERTELLLLRATLWAELREVLVLREELVLREVTALRDGEALLETDALREAEAEREKVDTREDPALRKALLLRVPDPKADVPLLRRRSPWRPLCSGPT